MCEPSVALECGSEQHRARLTAGPDVREHPCQPRWASFLKVSCGKTAVKTRAFRSEIIIMSVTVDSSRDEASCHTHKNSRALGARLGRTTSIHLPTPLILSDYYIIILVGLIQTVPQHLRSSLYMLLYYILQD